MGLGIALLIFLVGCIVSSVEDADYRASKREEQRHKELQRILSERAPSAPRQTRVTRRRIAKDKEGNVLAEEIMEERYE